MMGMNIYNGKVCIITGAASGICFPAEPMSVN